MKLQNLWKVGHGFPAAIIFFGAGILAGAMYRLPLIPSILTEDALGALAAFVGAAVAVGGSAWVWRWQQAQEVAQMAVAIEQAVQPFVDELIEVCSLNAHLPEYAEAPGEVDSLRAEGVHELDKALVNAEAARALTLRRLGHFHALVHRLGNVRAAEFYSIETQIEESREKIQSAKQIRRMYGGSKGLTLQYGIRPVREVNVLKHAAASLSMSIGIITAR